VKTVYKTIKHLQLFQMLLHFCPSSFNKSGQPSGLLINKYVWAIYKGRSFKRIGLE
jgi:hypothetical protein